jgi:hypothetical protein
MAPDEARGTSTEDESELSIEKASTHNRLLPVYFGDAE